MNDHHEKKSPKGYMSRRTALVVAGLVALVIVGFFVIRSAITISSVPTPDETPRDATVSTSASASPSPSDGQHP